MRAMLFTRPGAPLVAANVPQPRPSAGQVLLRVRACGVCRTDLPVLDGELTSPKLPLVLGPQIVGEVVERGAGARVPAGARLERTVVFPGAEVDAQAALGDALVVPGLGILRAYRATAPAA